MLYWQAMSVYFLQLEDHSMHSYYQIRLLRDLCMAITVDEKNSEMTPTFEKHRHQHHSIYCSWFHLLFCLTDLWQFASQTLILLWNLQFVQYDNRSIDSLHRQLIQKKLLNTKPKLISSLTGNKARLKCPMEWLILDGNAPWINIYTYGIRIEHTEMFYWYVLVLLTTGMNKRWRERVVSSDLKLKWKPEQRNHEQIKNHAPHISTTVQGKAKGMCEFLSSILDEGPSIIDSNL